jgi:hypothetical protein
MFFNLVDESAPVLSKTTSTWHVSRSVGLYQREAEVFASKDIGGGREKPLDLYLSGVATGLIGGALLFVNELLP